MRTRPEQFGREARGDELTNLRRSVAALERTNRRIIRGLGVLLLFCLVATTFSLWSSSKEVHADAVRKNSILRVRGLVIVDKNGKDRVWIGAPLPNPMVLGKRYKRRMPISGILILDREGNERGGYVTNAEGDATLSLDSLANEQADLGTVAAGGAELSLQSTSISQRANVGSRIRLKVSKGPLLEMKQGGKVVFHAPVKQADQP